MTITTREIDGHDELEAFLALPDELLAGDPSYVPPLRAWLRRRLAPTNPLFKDARLKLFGTWRGGKMVGRISVLVDPRHNEHRGEDVAWFGFFDAVDDQAVADSLFAAAEGAATEWGCDRLRGSRNLTRLEDPGITIEGHDTLPPMLAAHHPPYYRALFETAGFEKHHDILAYEISLFLDDGSPRPLPDKLQRKADACSIDGLEVRSVKWRRVWSDLRLVYTVFDQSYRTVPDTAPIPWEQFVSLALSFLMFTNKHMVQLATVHGRPAGFVVCLPEINEAMGAWAGRLRPTGLFRFVRDLRRIRTAAFKLIGVMPEFRGSGLHAKMIAHTIDGVRTAGYERVDGSLIDERNKPMRGVVEGAGLTIYRKYRFFERAIQSTPH